MTRAPDLAAEPYIDWDEVEDFDDVAPCRPTLRQVEGEFWPTDVEPALPDLDVLARTPVDPANLRYWREECEAWRSAGVEREAAKRSWIDFMETHEVAL